MNEMDLSRQLGDLPEEMIAEAMAPAKVLHRKQVTARALRLAACFVLLIGVSFAGIGVLKNANFHDSQLPSVNAPRKTEIGVQLHTNEGVVELGASDETVFFGGEDASLSGEVQKLPDSYNRYVFNSITGEWELINNNSTLSCLTLELWWSDYFNGQAIDITVLKNGKEVDFADKTDIFRSYIGQGISNRSGWAVRCYFVEQTTLTFCVRNETDGTLLMELTILVTPAIYYSEVTVDGVTQITEKEGYKVDVVKSYIKMDE